MSRFFNRQRLCKFDIFTTDHIQTIPVLIPILDFGDEVFRISCLVSVHFIECILRRRRQLDLIPFNPADRVERPKDKKHVSEYYTA